MHLGGIAEFFFNRAGGSQLDELAKSCAGVGKAPRRQFYPEIVQRLPNRLGLFSFHRGPKPCPRVCRFPSNFLTPFLDSELLQIPARQFPPPTGLPRRLLPRLFRSEEHTSELKSHH